MTTKEEEKESLLKALLEARDNPPIPGDKLFTLDLTRSVDFFAFSQGWSSAFDWIIQFIKITTETETEEEEEEEEEEEHV